VVGLDHKEEGVRGPEDGFRAFVQEDQGHLRKEREKVIVSKCAIVTREHGWLRHPAVGEGACVLTQLDDIVNAAKKTSKVNTKHVVIAKPTNELEANEKDMLPMLWKPSCSQASRSARASVGRAAGQRAAEGRCAVRPR
jgi:hypothetical protein